MFQLTEATELHRIRDMEDHFTSSSYTAWRGLREHENARYLGLCFPRFLLREPYNPDSYKGTIPFTEEIESHGDYVWGNAAYAFAARLTESFAQNGWCVNIRGPQSGGMVEDLPVHFFHEDGDLVAKAPTEIMISDRVELELSESGFIPLTYFKDRDYACFYSAQSVQKPRLYSEPMATANAKIMANLPYTFLINRFAHYLKVIQRENIGEAREKSDLQQELDNWLSAHVTHMPNPGQDLIAKRPLKEAGITWIHDPDDGAFYKVELFIRPFFQVEGLDVSLSLTMELPREPAT